MGTRERPAGRLGQARLGQLANEAKIAGCHRPIVIECEIDDQASAPKGLSRPRATVRGA